MREYNNKMSTNGEEEEDFIAEECSIKEALTELNAEKFPVDLAAHKEWTNAKKEAEEKAAAELEFEEYNLRRTLTELEWENKGHVNQQRFSTMEWTSKGPVLTVYDTGMNPFATSSPTKQELNDLIIDSLGIEGLVPGDYSINYLNRCTLKHTYKELLCRTSAKLIFHPEFKRYDDYYNIVYQFTLTTHRLTVWDTETTFKDNAVKYNIDNIKLKRIDL